MNVEDLKDLDEETRKVIEELLKVTREKDGNEAFAEAQATIGEFLIKNKKPEKAIEAWSKVERSDNSNLYAKLQINIGIAFIECGNIINALKSWRNVTRSDDQEVYANSQFYTGIALKEKGSDKEAIEAWSNIERLDNLDLYAKAKLNIGLALIGQQDSEGALVAWKSVKHADSPEIYASTQMNIGNMLKENHDNQGALQAFYNVKRDDDAIAFAHAQFNIGAILQELGDNNRAIEIWEEIIPLDDPEVYAKAQFNIGITSYKNSDKEVALAILESINHADSANVYAKAQYVVAKILKEKNNYGDALKALCSIEQSDDPETYANAELIISSLLDEIGSHTSSLEALRRVKHQDSSVAYSLAQWLIGSDFEKNGNIEEAIKRWSNINYLDNPQVYAFTQYQTGLLLIRDSLSKKYTDSKQAFTNAETSYPYEAYCYKKICDLLLDPNLETTGYKTLLLLDKALEIVEILQLDFGRDSDDFKSPERKLAHYTSTDTANLLLESDGEVLPSAFRLNTINNVNDPSEGQLLLNYLKDIKERTFHTLDFDKNLHAFIGCFTFNHDSLNQFRLYGKQDNKEASGVSLVFKKEFFQSDVLLGGLSFLSLNNEAQNLNNDIVINSFEKKSVLDEKANYRVKLSKKPVMRCVYLDPTSDYIHLAQRNRLTFFREFGDEKIKIEVLDDSKEIIWADVEWEKYKFELRSKTKDFGKAFKELKKVYKELTKQVSDLKNIEPDILIDISTLSNEILLPLKYLIKHSAFQEEQECRMIYITSVNAPEVMMQHKKLLFVEYQAKVKENLNKVYIAPAATEYQLYLSWLLRDSDVKIELSNNPYRQT